MHISLFFLIYDATAAADSALTESLCHCITVNESRVFLTWPALYRGAVAQSVEGASKGPGLVQLYCRSTRW